MENIEKETIEINIPIHINLCGKRSEAEKHFIAMEHLEIKAGTLLKHINLLNFSASGFTFEVDEKMAVEYSEMASELILSILKAVAYEREKLERLIREKVKA